MWTPHQQDSRVSGFSRSWYRGSLAKRKREEGSEKGRRLRNKKEKRIQDSRGTVRRDKEGEWWQRR
jgi:hypothetical protein